jgi:hypothetical protein
MATAEGAGGAADKIAQAHARLLKDHELQFAFTARPPPPKPPDWLKPLGELLEAITPFMKWVFWIALALAAAAILYFIVRELIYLRWPSLKKRGPKSAPEPEWRPEPARARALLEDADRLAAEGRYAEAAHLLLHRSIEDIEGRRPRAVRPALTARDIGRLESLPPAARGPFQAIAEVVERSFFGGREVDAGAFAECRRAYEAFAFPEAWA